MTEELGDEVEALRATLSASELEIDEAALAQRLSAPATAALEDVRVTLRLQCGTAGAVVVVVTVGPLYPQPAAVQLRLLSAAPGVDAQRLVSQLQQLVLDSDGQPCLWPLADFILSSQDTFASSAAGADRQADQTLLEEQKLERCFIYFHHIYNSHKRRDILQWAHELNLSGFSMPGKPGVVCAEGRPVDVREYLRRLRSLPWQRMQVRATETTDCGSRALSEARKFPSLAEVAFPSHGDLRLYLKDHGVDDSVFVQLFDVGEPDS